MSTNETRTDSSTYNIDKLTETNYRSWAQQLQWIFDERNLWEIVNGMETRPRRPTVDAPTSKDAEEVSAAQVTLTTAIAEYETRLEDFIQGSKKA